MPQPPPLPLSTSQPLSPVTRHALAALLVLVASAAYCLFYLPANGRELHLWTVFGHLLRPILPGSAPFEWGQLLAGWGVVYLLGGLVVAAARPWLPRLWWGESVALAWIAGMGVVGLLGQYLALAGIMFGRPVALGLAGFTAAFSALAWRNRPLSPAPLPKPPAMPPSFADRSAHVAAAIFLVIAGLIHALTFWHALLYPVTYWDAMILYVGHARLFYLTGGVPEMVVGQVGVGLGANYPHLFGFLHTALVALISPGWTSIHAQGLSPMCAVSISLLLFAIMRRLGAGLWAASATVLVGIAFHYIIAYYQYASNYPMAMAFTALFVWGALAHFQSSEEPDALHATRQLQGGIATAMAAAMLAVHVNYLMWALWLAGLVVVAASPVWRLLLRSRWFWAMSLVFLLLSAPWYVRNVIVTGNPVYAFFSEIFPSRNVNPEVMESAGLEWLMNGDGIGRHAHDLIGPNPTLIDKLRATPAFIATGPQAYKLGPVFLGWMLPGALLALAVACRRALQGRMGAAASHGTSPAMGRVHAVAGFIAAFLVFYHYAVADFYLYQILPFLVPMTLFAGYALMQVERSRPALAVASLLLVLTGLVPGLAFGLMGLKAFEGGMQLQALHFPLMHNDDFYRLRYGGDVDMWNYVNRHLAGQPLLTHENRHLIIDPSIPLIHLDHWEMQAAYDLPTALDRLTHIKAHGLRYYLQVPNEARHPVNLRLGIQELIGTPHLREVFRAVGKDGPNVLYEIVDEPLTVEDGEGVEEIAVD